MEEKEFIMYTGSLVTIISPVKEMIKNERISPITKKYQDVDKNEVKFARKIMVEAESRGKKKNLTILITER